MKTNTTQTRIGAAQTMLLLGSALVANCFTAFNAVNSAVVGGMFILSQINQDERLILDCIGITIVVALNLVASTAQSFSAQRALLLQSMANHADSMAVVKRSRSDSPINRDISMLFNTWFVAPIAILVLFVVVKGTVFIYDVEAIRALATLMLGLIPEGLVLFATLAMAAASLRLAKHGIILRNIYAPDDVAYNGRIMESGDVVVVDTSIDPVEHIRQVGAVTRNNIIVMASLFICKNALLLLSLFIYIISADYISFSPRQGAFLSMFGLGIPAAIVSASNNRMKLLQQALSSVYIHMGITLVVGACLMWLAYVVHAPTIIYVMIALGCLIGVSAGHTQINVVTRRSLLFYGIAVALFYAALTCYGHLPILKSLTIFFEINKGTVQQAFQGSLSLVIALSLQLTCLHLIRKNV